MSWMTCALLSAIFAGLTAVLAKVGVANVPSNLATLVRTIAIVAFATGIVVARVNGLRFARSTRSWTFLVLSGVGTGLSWLFYFAAPKDWASLGVVSIDN